jgi:hypothetical protein
MIIPYCPYHLFSYIINSVRNSKCEKTLCFIVGKTGADMVRPMNIYDNSMVDKNVFAMDERTGRERRSGVERRVFSYSWHIPERRSGIDKRKQRENA